MCRICYRHGYIIVLLLALAGSAARAQKVTVHFEPSQSDIKWSLGGTIHTTHGTFKLKGGLMIFDAKSGIAEGEILVDADSGESANESRDRRMKNEVLETQRYPQIFFHPAKVSGWRTAGPTPGSTAAGFETMVVEGTLNIHGADHPLTLSVKAQREGKNLTASTSFIVPYVKWGMKDPSAAFLRVKKEVEIDISAHGNIEIAP